MCCLAGRAAGSLDGDQMNFPQRSGSKAPKPWLLESRDLHSMLLAAGLWVWGQCRSGKGRNYRWPSAAPQTSLASASEDRLMVSTSSLSSLLFQAVVGAATESCASLEASWKLRMEALASWLAFSSLSQDAHSMLSSMELPQCAQHHTHFFFFVVYYLSAQLSPSRALCIYMVVCSCQSPHSVNTGRAVTIDFI